MSPLSSQPAARPLARIALRRVVVPASGAPPFARKALAERAAPLSRLPAAAPSSR